MKVRPVLLGAAALGAVCAIVGISFIAGYAFSDPNFDPYSFVQKALKKVLGESAPVLQFDRQGKTQYESVFLQLEGDVGSVPADRSGAGGGLTSFGDSVLLLTHEGKIFAARSASDIRATAIEAPDNGFDAYVRAAKSERFESLTHHFHQFRYNDLLYYRSPHGHGLVASYTEFLEENACYGTALAVLELDPSVLSVEEISARKDDWQVIYRTEPCLPLKEQFRAIEGHMAGGRIVFSPPTSIFLGSGDYHWDGLYAPEAIAQRPNGHYGKVMKIDLVSHQAVVVSLGHRNMQGITLDRTGQLWVVEHGARGGDELNRVVQGENYGWPEETLGTQYNKRPWPNTRSYGRHEIFTPPTYAWLPSVAISSLSRIEGFHESWDGDLLMASLTSLSLYRLRIKDDRLMFAEQIRIGKRIRYAHQHTDGRLVLWTDDRTLIFVSVGQGKASKLEEQIARADYSDAQRSKVRQALTACMECHSFEPGARSNAPNLASIYKAPVAGSDFGGYSQALKSRGGRWTRNELSSFLKDPQAYAPGSTMPNPGIDDASVLSAIVDLMDGLTGAGE